MKKPTISLTIAIVLTALIITFDSHHQALAAPSVKKIEVTDGGIGTWACSKGTIFPDGASESRTHTVSGIDFGVTVDKVTGKVSGTWQIISFDGTILAAGDITGGKMKADSFTLSGVMTLTDDFCSAPTPIPVTIAGRCGNDVTISFKADKQDPDFSYVQTAIYTHVSISCTK